MNKKDRAHCTTVIWEWINWLIDCRYSRMTSALRPISVDCNWPHFYSNRVMPSILLFPPAINKASTSQTLAGSYATARMQNVQKSSRGEEGVRREWRDGGMALGKERGSEGRNGEMPSGSYSFATATDTVYYLAQQTLHMEIPIQRTICLRLLNTQFVPLYTICETEWWKLKKKQMLNMKIPF